MTPFDAQFAYNYVLGQAEAAYVTTPPAGFARTWEIIATVPAAVAAARMSPGVGILESAQTPSIATTSAGVPAHMDAFNAMLMQPPAPSKTAVAHATVPEKSAPVAPNLHFGWVTADTAKGILTVAIRGTEYFAEWLKDADFAPTPYRPLPGKGDVHNGFQVVYYSIRDAIQSVVKEARAAYPQIGHLLITGHSLGAACVGLAAPDLIANAGHGMTTLVYTLAEPRVGHANYKHFFDSVVPVCYRIDNFWDIVPHLPPLLAFYEHEGVTVNIDSGFSLDVGHNHRLATGYEPGLKKLASQHAAARASLPESSMVNIQPTYIGATP